MKAKEFLTGLLSFIKENYSHDELTVLKDGLKFKEKRYVYGEISFGYSNCDDAFTVHLSMYNKEIQAFFTANRPPYYKGEIGDCVFAQSSVASAHYFEAPPNNTEGGRFIYIRHLENPDASETQALYADILEHLKKYHIPMMMEMKHCSPKVLEYLVTQPSFYLPLLVALFIVEKNNLTASSPEVQQLFAFEERVRKNENGLFSLKGDLIFKENDFDEAIKKRILTR